MEVLLALVVLATALVILAYPLYLAQTRTRMISVSTLDDLIAQRNGVYATLRDLDLDHELGKLDEHDYQDLRERYMTRATEIIKQLDALGGAGISASASEEIEKEVAALRGGRRGDDRGRTTKDERETRNGKRETRNERVESQAGAGFCPNCGNKHEAGDRFCAKCGQALTT